MRHVGSSLHSLTLSRALPVTNSAKRPRGNGTSGGNGGDVGGGSVVVNLWEEEDASLHLAHISRHCTNLRSLSLGHVSLSAPTLLASLQPMPALQHLSLSWIHASPAALHAVLDNAPNLLHFTVFMASGFPHLELRVPPSLQHLSLSYIRADSVALLSARSLQSLSLRDMFLRSLSIRDAPNLRQLAVSSANCLLVSAPHSSRLESIDLRAGSLNWPATETLISSNSAALESLSLDFFAIVNLFSAMSGGQSGDSGEAVLLLALPHVRLYNDLLALQRVSRSLYRTIRESPCFWLRFHHLHVEPFPISHRHVSASLNETAVPRTTGEIRPIATRGDDPQQLAALPRYKLVEAALKVYARRSQGQLREVVLDGEDVRGDVIITVLAGCNQLEKLSVRMCAHVTSSHIVTLLQSQWGALAASTAPAPEASPLPSLPAAELVSPPAGAPSASSSLLADSLPESHPPIPPSSLESTQPATLESAQPATLVSLQSTAPEFPQSANLEPPQVPTAAAPAPGPRLWQVRMAGSDCPSTEMTFESTQMPPQVPTAAAPTSTPRLWQVRMAGTDCPSAEVTFESTQMPPQVPTAAAPVPTPRLWQVRMAGSDCPSIDFLFIRDMLKRAAASLPAPRRAVLVAHVDVCGLQLAVLPVAH
ncbi:unnamed protein product [Closterium sp. Naga37s-1]|nr:unnamed protein product [Closterium sp. Naga37s-1]